MGRTRVVLQPRRSLRASGSLSSHLQPISSPPQAGSCPLKANIVLPKGVGLTALDIQLVYAWRRQQARGRQRGWSRLPGGEGALPMHPVPAPEEITPPAAARALARALKPGRRLQLLT